FLLKTVTCSFRYRPALVMSIPMTSAVSELLGSRSLTVCILVLRLSAKLVLLYVLNKRMTNGAMNVEIGNPAYKIYEGEPDDDAGELLDSDFALDPDKPTNFTNPVYATLYMGAHNSRNSLASTDEKKELLSAGDEDMGDPRETVLTD
uniref:Uncharacterized protein n=1 Tax=Astyanax mexicanus TaxID=7994 RepID=A0A8B9KYJ5_ASTMX